MERRKAITVAAAASLTLLAGGAGMALSSNIVGTGANDGVGQLSPVSSLDNPPITVFVDDQSDPTATVATPPPVQRTDATPLTTSSASGYSDEEYEDEGEDEGDDHDEYEEHEDDEYEGGEDDD